MNTKQASGRARSQDKSTEMMAGYDAVEEVTTSASAIDFTASGDIAGLNASFVGSKERTQYYCMALYNGSDATVSLIIKYVISDTSFAVEIPSGQHFHSYLPKGIASVEGTGAGTDNAVDLTALYKHRAIIDDEPDRTN